MTPRTAQLIEGANRALTSAQRELEASDLETAAERACVAMLRLAKACLDVEGVSAGPAEAVCSAYGRHFIESGLMYSAYFRWLLDALDLRKAAGSEFATRIDYDAAATVVERAEIFRDAPTRFVARSPKMSATALAARPAAAPPLLRWCLSTSGRGAGGLAVSLAPTR